jgi:hypothetical protein
VGSFSIWHWLIVLVIFSPIIIGLAFMGLQKKVLLRHSQSGLTKTGYVGWSWTYFFFGWFVPIIRGEIGIGLLHLVLTAVTFGLFQWIMSLIYNKQYMTRLLLSGWQLDQSDANYQLAVKKLGITDH